MMINNKLYKSLDFGAPYFQKKNDTNWICFNRHGFQVSRYRRWWWAKRRLQGSRLERSSGPSRSCRSGMLPTQKAFFLGRKRDLQMAPLACWRSCPGAMVCLHVSPWRPCCGCCSDHEKRAGMKIYHDHVICSLNKRNGKSTKVNQHLPNL